MEPAPSSPKRLKSGAGAGTEEEEHWRAAVRARKTAWGCRGVDEYAWGEG